ncbi:MAG: DUF885 domain-containing protein [Duganella sp.]
MMYTSRIATLGAALALTFIPLSNTVAMQLQNTPPRVSAASAHQALQAIASQYYDAVASFEPIGATESGDNRYDSQLGLSISPGKRTLQFKLYEDFAKRLKAIKRDHLNADDRLNYDILRYELRGLIAMQRFPEHLLPINQMDSIPVTLANYAGGEASQPIGTVAQYDAYLSRISQMPAWIDQAISNMRDGVKRGITQPRAIMVSALPQFKKLQSDTPEASIYYTPITKLPASFSDADKQRLTAAYRQQISEHIMPALTRLATYLEKEYIPACRTSTGLGALPDGAAWYQARVANATTTSLKPDEIHAIGLREVARIQSQFEILGPKLGYDGPAAGLPVWVAAQPKFRPFKTDDEVQAVYRKLNDVLDTKLPMMFTLIPKAKLDLRLEPELSRDTAADHYTAPAIDGSRPGVFWSVVTDPAKYINTGMTTLYLHEGKPGHHFHIALMQELNLPDFRKFGGNNAFTEGWALYAETLGKEMGLFDDPAQYFGHLNDELLRATRLVVDTGMHAKGWTREQSIDYMRKTLGYDEVARSETERYMAWPAQALGYKIGSLKIVELRHRAEEALGERFSLPKFHEVILGDGTLPLALLEEKVDRWIAAQQ